MWHVRYVLICILLPNPLILLLQSPLPPTPLLILRLHSPLSPTKFAQQLKRPDGSDDVWRNFVHSPLSPTKFAQQLKGSDGSDDVWRNFAGGGLDEVRLIL